MVDNIDNNIIMYWCEQNINNRFITVEGRNKRYFNIFISSRKVPIIVRLTFFTGSKERA